MDAHQHHHPGHAHPPATVSPSILRLSVLERLGVVAVIIARRCITSMGPSKRGR
jgi:hypothetical protein